MLKKIVFLLPLLLTACGYHLRGADGLNKSITHLYVSGDTAALHDQFDKTMQISAGELVNNPDDKTIRINILKEDMQRRVLSLSSRGRANEFELVYHLKYDLHDGSNKALLQNQAVEIRREYFNNQQDILAKDNEENVIRNEMYQQAVQTILNRARTVLSAQVK